MPTIFSPVASIVKPVSRRVFDGRRAAIAIPSLAIDYLIVGGGGSGGYYIGGGGGAGEVYPSPAPIALVAGVTYSFVVGAGAAPGGYDGSPSTFSIAGALIKTAVGGLAGVLNGGAGSGNGGNSGNGFSGGAGLGFGGNYGGAGGGGATEAGKPNTNTPNAGGDGGLGYVWIDGRRYGNGGGGAASNNAGTPTIGRGGAQNGSGDGQAYDASGNIILSGAQQGSSGFANTGDGGGGGNIGANNWVNTLGGGSGIGVLAVPAASYTGVTTGSPTIEVVGATTYIRFLSSGSYTA
ncbi:hypothetical protein UFOVP607_53 [uncultured Caudovirales phage]|uniref:Glycine-rich domain-containing protein n=1 Tax=uncultured Caudovirales phage TaxID=2100421 RepID=A0A6J5N721_9CAUD|nr:hypothetical protein UFOVP607_53 [uncultured Caudovirales phage]